MLWRHGGESLEKQICMIYIKLGSMSRVLVLVKDDYCRDMPGCLKLRSDRRE